MSERKEVNVGSSVAIVFMVIVFLLIVLCAGEPDLLDAITAAVRTL
jgi:hypothetical protein